MVLLALVGGCSAWPGLERPYVDAGGYLALYRLRGRARMNSFTGSGSQSNPGMELREFGVGERDDDIGGFLSVGDGFSGFDFNYYRLTMQDTTPGTLSSAFGSLAAGEVVVTAVTMDEWRARYLAKVAEYTFPERIVVAFGVGLALAHRDLEFFPKQQATGAGQILTAKDYGVPYLAARLRGSYGVFSLTLDWAYDDGVDFGGDFEGRLQDIELLGRYEFLRQDVTLFAGYRYTELPARGHEGGLEYRADLRLEGLQVGLQMRF